MTRIECARIRAEMLEADLPELKGTAGTPLSEHIASCGDCRAVADRLLAAYRELDSGLSALGPRRNVLPLRRRIARWAPLPLAAAAVLALLLTRPATQEVKEPTQLAALMFKEEPLVTPPAGKQAMVMEKNDLTVVWLY